MRCCCEGETVIITTAPACSPPSPTPPPPPKKTTKVSADDLLSLRGVSGSVTEAGIRGNLSVALAYMESWLRGVG